MLSAEHSVDDFSVAEAHGMGGTSPTFDGATSSRLPEQASGHQYFRLKYCKDIFHDDCWDGM
jgi:hypothetical protein